MMSETHKESFMQIKQLVDRIAHETGCDTAIQRIRRKQATTYELIPNGSPYGPRLRITDTQMRNPAYIQNLIETEGVKLRDQIETLQEQMKSWSDED